MMYDMSGDPPMILAILTVAVILGLVFVGDWFFGWELFCDCFLGGRI